MKNIKNALTHIFSRPVFQRTFEGLLNLSLKILNIGEGHTVETSGEKAVFDLLRKKMKGAAAIVFDVGAHTGEWYSLFKKNYLGEANVYCFEPSIDSYDKLMETKDARCHPENIALGETIGKSRLISNGSGASTAHISNQSENSAHGSENIEMTTLDRYCSDHGIKHIDLLKIDVEGYELKVLAGASKMIKNGNIDLIQFEFGAESEERYSMKEFFELLSGRYEICRILKHGYYPLKKYRHYYEIMTVTNFIAIKR